MQMMWLRRRWAWAKANRLLWFNLVLIVISGLVIFICPGPTLATGPSDVRLRTWGLLLQLIGVVTVWLDLTRTARKFGKGGFVRHTLSWLKAYLHLGVAVEAGVGETAIIGDRARAKVRRPIQANAPLPDRVTTVETVIAQIDDDLDAAYREIDERASDLGAKIEAEGEQRGRAISEVTKSLEDAVAGNLATLAFGVVWLAAGIVIATLAPEIAKIVGGQWREVWRAL
jgi:hypothetical protein